MVSAGIQLQYTTLLHCFESKMAASISLLLLTLITVATHIRVIKPRIPSKDLFQTTLCTFINHKSRETVLFKQTQNRPLIILVILLSGDIELNPGPTNKSMYPCAMCDLPVTWDCMGVCCNDCSMWHHKSCMELCTKDYDLLHVQRSCVQWLCCKCNSMNVSSFSFRSFEIDSNYYAPIQDLNITLESIASSAFSPLKTSSPNPHTTHISTVSNHSCIPRLQSTDSELPSPGKRNNLCILNINCRSIVDNKTEFIAMLEYLKSDVCATESWLHGVKP